MPLQGAIRDHVTRQRRPYIRFFACSEDLSHQSPDALRPDQEVAGTEPFSSWEPLPVDK
jgi:sulfur-carrier protein